MRILEQDGSPAIDVHLDYNDPGSRATRNVIFQLLYAFESTEYDCSLFTLIDAFNRGFGLTIPMGSEAVTLVRQIAEQRLELDEAVKPLLTRWRFERIGVCTKLILRIALWELQNSSLDTALILNEAIELAKSFAEHDSYKFINGVLDRYVKLHMPNTAEQVTDLEKKLMLAPPTTALTTTESAVAVATISNH